MDAKTDIIIKQLLQVINQVIFAEKKKVFQFQGVSLFPSEVHLLLVINNDTNTNATVIAELLGLTKGAVSQTISRLVKKGILQKTKDTFNKNELTLSLTDFGQEAFAHCISSQEAFVKTQSGYIDKLDTKDKEVLLDFLIHMEKTLAE